MNQINYISDSVGWVQSGRYKIINKYLNDEFEFHNVNSDILKYNLFRFFNKVPPYTYFASWRMVLRNNLWESSDLSTCMASVTSHSNIGGGLNVFSVIGKNNAIGDKEIVFNKAVHILKKFKVVTVNSMRLYELLEPSLENIIYLPNGVESKKFIPLRKKNYDKKNIVIGWVGKKRFAKNYDLLLELKNKLQSDIIIKELIVEKSQKSILNQEEMIEYYNSIDYYLCTSWDEGTPNPALEAASCGIPVISTRVGNMPELIEHGRNGFFIDPTIDSLMEIFNEVRTLDEVLYKEFSIRIRQKIVNSWSWEKQILGYKEAFKKLLDER